MLIQRKLLTKKQKEEICDKYSDVDHADGYKYCGLKCPLRANILNGIGEEMDCSCRNIGIIENSIKNYWEEEVEVQNE